ncbi:gametogenetin-binding protein 1-like isoform X1 [Lutra lutra]|uniref:gametogenetin-binding protein 1-like isoform X1 n=1 Tax=Lutra lutra TaxID=9657 RepID=UPI001FD37158|nr:gametogenetin-binding protein 1-like isoform X1 [Lutra lutra]
MEAPGPTPQSRILGHSSMFLFFRSLVGSRGSPKSSDKALMWSRPCPSQEQSTTPLMRNRQGGAGRKEPRQPATLPYMLSVALPQHDPLGLGMGDTGAQNPTPKEVLRVAAQGGEVKPILSRGSQEVLGNVSKKEKREEKEAVGEASGDTRTSDRGHFAQALEVKQGCPQRAMGPPEVSPKTFTREEEKECLLDGDFRLASLKVGATPWNRLLTLYKQLQKSAMAKFPLKEGLPDEKNKEKEMEVEDRSFKLCVPGIVTLQSPLHKTFRSTDTVGFVESELKKLLAVQRDSRLWKVGSHDGQELLTKPEITLEQAGIVDGQRYQAEGERSRPPAFGECWGPRGGALRQRKQHPRLEGRVQSPPGVVSRTEHLLLEEMDELGNWPPE